MGIFYRYIKMNQIENHDGDLTVSNT